MVVSAGDLRAAALWLAKAARPELVHGALRDVSRKDQDYPMTSDRDPTIPLGPEYTRCTPKDPGMARARCARGRATVPAHGGTVEDYTLRPGNHCSVLCVGYVDINALRKQAAIVPPPKVHKAPRGI